MKFKMKRTGSVLETSNEFVIKQMQKSDAYEELKPEVKEAMTEEKDIKPKKVKSK